MQARDPLKYNLTKTTKTHNGINYAVITQAYNNNEVTDINFECNCSIFKAENEVKEFINKVFS